MRLLGVYQRQVQHVALLRRGRLHLLLVYRLLLGVREQAGAGGRLGGRAQDDLVGPAGGCCQGRSVVQDNLALKSTKSKSKINSENSKFMLKKEARQN